MSFIKMKSITRPSDGFVMDCVDKPDAVAVVLFNSTYTKVLLVKQFRVGAFDNEIDPSIINGEIYELPAGVVENKEEPIKTMYREIKEETGYYAEDLLEVINLGTYFVSPGYTSEKMHLFKARVKPGSIRKELELDEHEELISEWFNVEDVNTVSSDMKTQLAVTMALAIPKKKIGIYGGSFNPITHLHLLTLERAIEEFKLDLIVIEPVGDGYSKEDLIPVKFRVEMLELATKDNDSINVGDYERNEYMQPNTINTLQHYKSIYGWCEIYFICGSDNLRDMCVRPWPNYNHILEEFNIICIQRNDDNVYQDIILHDKNMVANASHIHVIHENVVNNISASAIRNLVRAGKSIKYLLPVNVEEYIYTNKLYKQ